MDGGGGKFLKEKDVKKILGVSGWALRNWADTGKINSVRTPGGHRLYQLPELQPSKPVVEKRGIVYARVSSHKQQDDLGRQIAFLATKYPGHLVVSDVASGINWKRKGLKTILDHADKGTVDEVVVASRDRLCRFAFDLLADVLARRGVLVRVLDSDGVSEERELADDLLSIVQIFCCKRNGRRRYGAADAKDQAEPEPPATQEAR